MNNLKRNFNNHKLKNMAGKYIKHKLLESQGELDRNTIILWLNRT